MSKFFSLLTLSCLACALLLSGCYPPGRYGYGYGGYGYGGGYHRPPRQITVTCESLGGRSEYCPTGMRGYIRLERQLSDTPCREYDTWGTDRDGGGSWVDHG